jgi:hypothetical protein
MLRGVVVDEPGARRMAAAFRVRRGGAQQEDREDTGGAEFDMVGGGCAETGA